jgi:hypothetical protein
MATTKKTTSPDEAIIAVAPSQSESNWQEIINKQQKENEERLSKMHQDLSEPFPSEVERKLKKGGTSLTYIPVSEVITRLNKVLGFDGWAYQIIKCERDALDPDFIVAHVRLDVFPHSDKFTSISKDGFGGQKIKRTKQGDIVDLGDEFKGAVSDALKKAAQALGVGLYLARTEEAMEAVEAQSLPPEPVVNPMVSEMWQNFIGLSKNLNSDGKAELNSFWSEYGKGRPKPTLQTATAQDIEELIGECIRISFNGTEVTSE